MAMMENAASTSALTASTVRATLNVAPANDAPRLLGETVAADEDTVVTLKAAQLLANDHDVDGGALSIVSADNASHGSVVLQADAAIGTAARARVEQQYSWPHLTLRRQ